jgi:hypothetical protein
MPKKLAKLPDANEQVIGAPLPQPNAPVVPLPVPSSKPLRKSAPMNATSETISARRDRQPTQKKGRTQISVYFTKETLKRLEEVKARLRFDYNLKANKSDIIEYALNEGLAQPERLAQSLRDAQGETDEAAPAAP